MKKILLFLWAVLLYGCNSQSQLLNKKIKKQNMEYFNIEKYKEWEVDTDWSPSKFSKRLKKGNDRVKIFFTERGSVVELMSALNHYILYKSYFPNKSLKVIGRRFYDFYIGKWQVYDENGKLIKEEEEDAPYKFSVDQLIKKIKKEYDLDIEKNTKTTIVDRWLAPELNKKPFYSVSFRGKEGSTKWDYILVDGSTGETLFTSFFYFGDEETSYPFGRYIESLIKKEAEDNAYYKSYKGKDYTKKEWEIFVEKFHEDYQKNKKRSFWDDIFSRSTDD